jgi:chorismate synthase
MSGNIIGQAFQLISWGESHGPAIGGVVDGVPPNIPLTQEEIQQALQRRQPGQSPFTSPRQEPDTIEILSGVFEGKTLGTPISFLIRNTNAHSQDYEAYREVLRPGHADYTYWKKYGIRDHRGGGRASARETAVRVAAGAIATKILAILLSQPITIRGALIQIDQLAVDRAHWNSDFIDQNPFFCPDPTLVPRWEDLLKQYAREERSAGALIEITMSGLPPGLGEPVYDRLDADLAKALMSINAVKGVEIGQGFASVGAERGYDELTPTAGFTSNLAGGILGGISTGQDIICRIAIKPTSSTPTPRQTVTHNNDAVTLPILGRHDPCIGIRAVPVAEAMVALVLADHCLRWRGQCGPLTAF